MLGRYGGSKAMRRWILPVTICLLPALPVLAQELPPEDAQPLTLPRPNYPAMASFFWMSGYCEVRFAVDQEGYAFNLYPRCTDYIFCYEAKRSVSEATFKPKYMNGRPQIRDNVVYPLSFVMEGQSPDSIDESRLKPCRKHAVS